MKLFSNFKRVSYDIHVYIKFLHKKNILFLFFIINFIIIKLLMNAIFLVRSLTCVLIEKIL